MKDTTIEILEQYKGKYAFIKPIERQLLDTTQMLCDCFNAGAKLLICGNGGSNADADHIVGELLKGFVKKRPLSNTMKVDLQIYGPEYEELGNKLQESLPAINLGAHTSLITAVINDIGAEAIFAQQVLGFGKQGDILLGISTSGNSKNILHAAAVAKIKGVKTIALTGETGGKMRELFDITLTAPSCITCDIQDMHSIIYHLICQMVENEFWDE